MKPNHSYLIAQPNRSSLLVWMLVCLIVVLALVLLIVQPALAQKKLTAAEAKDHMGETATVCGNVVSTRYAASTEGQPTFLYLDQTYPDKIFAVVIWGSKRSKFGKFATPEVEYRERQICVTGKITKYGSVPEITADSPLQIAVILVAPGILPFRVERNPIEQTALGSPANRVLSRRTLTATVFPRRACRQTCSKNTGADQLIYNERSLLGSESVLVPPVITNPGCYTFLVSQRATDEWTLQNHQYCGGASKSSQNRSAHS